MFISAWVTGLILVIVRLVRGQGLGDWFQMWRTSAVLGEVNVYPPVTPKMRREAILFTVIFGALVCVTYTPNILSWFRDEVSKTIR